MNAFARKDKLAIARFSARAEGVLDKTRAGLVFTSIRLHVNMTVPAADVERGERLLHTAKKFCIISNSLNVAVELEASVTGE